VIEFFNFVHFFSAMADNNTDPVMVVVEMAREERTGENKT
jgi:hypothetical protein